mgnify:CR=1 FL=1
MGLVRGRVGVDGRSLGDAPIPGVRSRSDTVVDKPTVDSLTRVDSPVGVGEEPTTGSWDEPTFGDEGFPVDDWEEPPYDDARGHDADALAGSEEASGAESPTDDPETGAGGIDGGHTGVSAPVDASDAPVTGERASLGTRIRSVVSRAATGRLGVFFNPVARFRELSARDSGGAVSVSPVRASNVSSRAAARDGDAGDSEFDAESELYPAVEDAAEGELLPVGDIEGDPRGDGDVENADEAEDVKGGASRADVKRGSRSSGRGGRTARAFVSLCRRVLGVLLWPLSFVSRFVSRLVARPLSFVVRVLSRAPAASRVVRLVSSVPRRVRRLLRVVVWAVLLYGVLFAFGWRPPFVPVSSGVAGVDLPDSGHLSVSAWRVDSGTVNVHVVNDGETVVEGESVEVRVSAWVPLSRLPWGLVTRTDGGSCVVDIDSVDVEDAADFIVSCPAVGGFGESVVPVGSSFGE